jgi:hypothetical protein
MDINARERHLLEEKLMGLRMNKNIRIKKVRIKTQEGKGERYLRMFRQLVIRYTKVLMYYNI